MTLQVHDMFTGCFPEYISGRKFLNVAATLNEEFRLLASTSSLFSG
jgi:hypothetical protein